MAKCPNCKTEMISGKHPADEERPEMSYYFCPKHCIVAQQLGEEFAYLIKGKFHYGKIEPEAIKKLFAPTVQSKANN